MGFPLSRQCSLLVITSSFVKGGREWARRKRTVFTGVCNVGFIGDPDQPSFREVLLGEGAALEGIL